MIGSKDLNINYDLPLLKHQLKHANSDLFANSKDMTTFPEKKQQNHVKANYGNTGSRMNEMIKTEHKIGKKVKSCPTTVNNNPIKECEGFIRECVDTIIEFAVHEGTNRETKVVDWHYPEELKEIFDFKLGAKAESHKKLLKFLKLTIRYSVKTGHPYFINQLYSGVDPYALIGQWLTDALNASVYTYEVAPVFSLMEEEVLSEMRRIIGYPNEGFGDGVFCPGGSISNGYAISCARFKYAPESKINQLPQDNEKDNYLFFKEKISAKNL